jgi:hypothetical protein
VCKSVQCVALKPVPGQPLIPRVAQGYIAGREQGREIGQRSAVGDGAGESVWGPADGLSDLGDHGPLDGSGPGTHLVDSHALVGDRADGVEEAGQWYRRGDLVADVAGIVEIESPIEHDLDEAGEILGDRCASGGGYGAAGGRRGGRARGVGP